VDLTDGTVNVFVASGLRIRVGWIAAFRKEILLPSSRKNSTLKMQAVPDYTVS